MRRMRAYSSSCSPVCRLSWSISIYFVANSLFGSRKSQKTTKTPIFGVQGDSRIKIIDVDTILRSSSLVLVCL